jgi:hypothetical protein
MGAWSNTTSVTTTFNKQGELLLELGGETIAMTAIKAKVDPVVPRDEEDAEMADVRRNEGVVTEEEPTSEEPIKKKPPSQNPAQEKQPSKKRPP